MFFFKLILVFVELDDGAFHSLDEALGPADDAGNGRLTSADD